MQQPDAPSLPLSSIRVDWTINARAAMRRETALEYAEALKAGAKFPPVTVFFDGMRYHIDARPVRWRVAIERQVAGTQA